MDVVGRPLSHPGGRLEAEGPRHRRRLEDDDAVDADQADDVGRPLDHSPEATLAAAQRRLRPAQSVAHPGDRLPHQDEGGDDVDGGRRPDRPVAVPEQQRDHVGHGEQGEKAQRRPRRMAETQPDEDDDVEQPVDETVVGAEQSVRHDQGEGRRHQPQRRRSAPPGPGNDPDHDARDHRGDAHGDQAQAVGPGREGHEGPGPDDQGAAQQEQRRGDMPDHARGQGARVGRLGRLRPLGPLGPGSRPSPVHPPPRQQAPDQPRQAGWPGGGVSPRDVLGHHFPIDQVRPAHQP